MRYYEPTVDLPNDGTLRDAIVQMVFTREDLTGARWETPGWAEINAGLDAAGIHHSLFHANVNIGDDVRQLPPEQLHDFVLSHIYTEDQMASLGPHTPGLAQILGGLAKRGISTEDGQLALRGLPYGDPHGADILNGQNRFDPM